MQGSGGLTAALELRRRGYAVTVFEELAEPGGMLRYGIPAYRLPREILTEEIDRILAVGIDLETNTRGGQDVRFAELESSFDAVFAAVGAHKSYRLGVPGEEGPGVHGAVEWLRAVNATGKAPVGTRVAVIGGGAVAMDAAMSAVRLGAQVTVIALEQRDRMLVAEEEGLEALEDGVQLLNTIQDIYLDKSVTVA